MAREGFRRHAGTRIGFLLFVALGLSLIATAAPLSEEEPNDEASAANASHPAQEIAGAIAPVGDIDMFEVAGLNTGWGVIALLDTDDASGSRDVRLTVMDQDGTTPLQSDLGSWEYGSGIALQPFTTDSGTPLYLKVNEEGHDATTSTYTLRYFTTVVTSQPETEPNETRATGTLSSFTHQGAITSAGDRDCYAFHGRAGDRIIVALNAEGSPLDAMLELVDLDDNILAGVDISGSGGKEFVECDSLPDGGIYAYCVSPASGSATGASATYRVGLVRNGGLYFPSWTHGIEWVNRAAEGYARPGDELAFRIAVTNTSPITIPGAIDLGLTYPADCLSLVDAQPLPSSVYTGTVSWSGQMVDLAPGEVYSATANLHADATCVEEVRMSLNLNYYVTGTGQSTRVAIFDRFLHLPVIFRPAP